MNYLRFELLKLKSRKWILMLAFSTSVLLPLLVRTLVNLSYSDKQISEGIFLEQAAFGFINYSTFYLFLPLWIILITGTEFANGHVNQVVFNTSFKTYFNSKVVYCFLVSLGFCLLGLITMAVIQLTAPFPATTSLSFYGVFIFQSFFTFFSISILAMSITFLSRNIAIAFVIYFVLVFAEGMVFMLIKKLNGTELFFLPFHITNILYVKGGERMSENYYNLFQEPDLRALVLPVFLFITLSLTYRDFAKRELKPLSD